MDPLKILDDLTIHPAEAVYIIGTGGKTTLLWFLCGLARQRGRVIAGPTAKMLPPEDELYTKLLTDPRDYVLNQHAPNTVQLVAGAINAQGKLLGLTEEAVNRLKSPAAYVILEADGSRGLPLKMWFPHEPVVFPSAELTLGILPITALEKVISSETTYHVEGFCQLSGLPEGARCTQEALIEMALAPDAMFRNSRGRRILLINQCDSAELFAQGQALAEAIARDPRGRMLQAIVCLSLKECMDEDYRHYSCRRLVPADEAK